MSTQKSSWGHALFPVNEFYSLISLLFHKVMHKLHVNKLWYSVVFWVPILDITAKHLLSVNTCNYMLTLDLLSNHEESSFTEITIKLSKSFTGISVFRKKKVYYEGYYCIFMHVTWELAAMCTLSYFSNIEPWHKIRGNLSTAHLLSVASQCRGLTSTSFCLL